MKGKKTLVIRFIVATLLIGTLGYSFYAFFSPDFSFLLGFCLSLLSILLSVFLLGAYKTERKSPNSWPLIFSLVLLGWIGLSLLYLRQTELLQVQLTQQSALQKEQFALIEASRKSTSAALISNILNKVDDELKNNPQKTLSSFTIDRICALSHSLQAYQYWEGDSLSAQSYSPERGQLLTALSLMKLDEQTFQKIKDNTSFAAADLKRVDLSGIDLSGINLNGANLSKAKLIEADLSGADLKGAKLWGADLQKADLNSADLKRTDFSWANLKGAKLRNAELNGVYLLNTQLRKADLRDTYIQWADLRGAFFDEADMRCVDLKGTQLQKASLFKANLQGAYLGRANFNDCNLIGTILLDVNMTGYSPVYLNNVLVSEKNWLDMLAIWRVKGAEEIKARYQLVENLAETNHYYLIDR